MRKKFVLMMILAMIAGTSLMAAGETTTTTTATAKTERSFWCQFGRSALLYIPNRLLDVSDLLTLKLGAGGPFAVKAKVTNFMEIGGTNGPQYFIGKGFNRQFGGGYQDGFDFGMFCWQTERPRIEDTFGTFNEFAMDKEFGLADCNQEPYKADILDFWSIGASAGVGVVCDVQCHIQTIPDLVLGFVCLDPNEDDLK